MKYLFILLLMATFWSCNSKFYDGEGNRIPKKAVRLLVQSQFVIMDSSENAYINKYFYFRK